MKLRIGVISDLHCHKKTPADKQASYILTNEETPIFQDPLKSLEYFLAKHPLSVDILLMPGDFGNACDHEGIKKGWEVTKTVGKLLNAKCVLPNIGNHDVDSRKLQDADPFAFIKSFADDFPFSNPAVNEFFWTNGYYILEETKFRILLINSVHNHTSRDEAEHGYISQEAINALEDTLSELNTEKLGIAMIHHCPIEHSHYDTKVVDFMYKGDELTALLDRFNFDLIVHGHKHDPRIRYSPGGINSPVIFSAGSFAAYPPLLLAGALNTFHIITLEVNEHEIGRGTIDTWFWVSSKGWNQNVVCKFIDAKVGFGASGDLKALANDIYRWFQTKEENLIEWEEFLNSFPDINFIIPSDFKKLKQHLIAKNIFISAKTFSEKTFIQYKPTT